MPHKVIIVPGLGDYTTNVQWATKHWKKFDLDPIVYSMQWVTGKERFAVKLNRLIKFIDLVIHF